MYTAGLRLVKKDPTKFTDGMNCAICHQLHSINKCPILNNILYIKKHFISYCLQMNKIQKQMLAAIHSIDATWGTSTTDNNNDDDDDDDDTGSHHGNARECSRDDDTNAPESDGSTDNGMDDDN